MFQLRYPLLWPLAAFVSGILLNHQLRLPLPALYYLGGVVILTALVLFFLQKKYPNLYIWSFSPLIFLCFCCLGMSVWSWRTVGYGQGAVAFEKDDRYLLHIREIDEADSNKLKLLVEVQSLTRSISSQPALIYIRGASGSSYLPGESLLCRTSFQWIKSPRNPHAFDYSAYMAKKGCFLQAFVEADEVLVWEGGTRIWQKRTTELQASALQKVDSWGFEDEERQLIRALLLGNKSKLSDELRQSYADVGVTHVLAVSGLHLGIVFLLIVKITNILGLRRKVWLRFVLLLLSLWSFAALTGFSTSVLRSACMFSFVAFGTALRRSSSVYNSLLASALFLLIWNPSFLFDLGFQLSYSAVFGIVWLQPKLAAFWLVDNPLLKFFWDLSTVSVAAQLATLPLSLFYFHQFPSAFLLANLLILPTVSLIMYLGLATLVLTALFGEIPLLPDLLNYVLKAMNALVHFLDAADLAEIKGIYLSKLQLASLYFLVWSVGLFLTFKKWVYLHWVMVSCLCIQVAQWWKSAELQKPYVVFLEQWYGDLLILQSGESLYYCTSDSKSTETPYAVRELAEARSAQHIVALPWQDDYADSLVCKQGDYILFADTHIGLSEAAWADLALVSEEGDLALPKRRILRNGAEVARSKIQLSTLHALSEKGAFEYWP